MKILSVNPLKSKGALNIVILANARQVDLEECNVCALQPKVIAYGPFLRLRENIPN